MKKIILCEGKMDAFLLGYFLDKRFGWKYIKEHIDRLPKLAVSKDNEVFYWYQHSEKPNQELAIWGVGGIDRISFGLCNVMVRNQREGTSTERFRQIVIFFDRDTRTKGECLELV